MGTVPEFSAGAITAGTRSIKTSDLLDLRKWLEQQAEEGGEGEDEDSEGQQPAKRRKVQRKVQQGKQPAKRRERKGGNS